MTADKLKEYIFENEKIEYILESIGCHNIVYHSQKEFYSCSNYDGDNKTAVNVKNNQYLNVVNWTRQKDFDDNSDIITLVQYNKHFTFIEAIKFLHDILGLEYKREAKQKAQEKYNPLALFEKIRNKSKHRRINVEEIQELNEEILDDYVPLLHIGWFREGVMPWTREKFGLAYSYKKKRVIIPMRHWKSGKLLGTNARTTVENYDEFGIKKYFITPSYPKSLNLYGLYENYESIKKAGYIVVVESEKSVLKRDSLNDSTLVALSGHTMSDVQSSIILGLNINEIVISLDKDIPIEEVWNLCERFYKYRKVSYMWDSWGLLGEKDSAVDKGSKIYDFLFKYRVPYDAEKHRQYLKSLEKK